MIRTTAFHTSLLVAHYSRLVRELVRAAATARGVDVIGETADARSLAARCAELRPEVLVTDADLHDGPVDDYLPAVRALGTRLVVLSENASPERLTTMLELGVAGYLLHDSGPDQVVDGVLAVARGHAVIDPVVAATVLRQWRRLRGGRVDGAHRSALTDREREVVAAMADGLQTKAIARRLQIAVKTVENHKIRIFDKLGARTQAHAVSLAIEHGLLVAASSSASTGWGAE